MANIEKVESVLGGLRQVIQDLVALELREIRALVQGINGRLDRMDARMDKLESTITHGFEDIRRQLDTYKDGASFERAHSPHGG